MHCDTAMNQNYTDIIQQLSQLLLQAIEERESFLCQNVEQLDSELAKLLRLVGLQVMSGLLNSLAQQVTQEAKHPGLVVHRRSAVKYSVIFGTVEVYSPYLWHKKEGWGVRPVEEKLGLEHRQHSIAVKRALVDFGVEESFGQAAKRFQEHYGWGVERSLVRRKVETIAQLAEQYVEQRLKKKIFKSPDQHLQNICDRVLVELDGSHVRTGIKLTGKPGELTQSRKIKKSSRQIDWREVRVGFARPVDQKEQRTFVARMDKYPPVVEQLKWAAYSQGMTSQSQVYAVADGGNGLREALEAQFPNLTFILDRSHIKQHIYQGADSLSLSGASRHLWVNHLLDLIDCGHTQKAIRWIKHYCNKAKNPKRLENLCNYLNRFSDASNYQVFRSRGLPIGSGEIESAHRYIPQKRLKIPGATWHPNTINPMLALRVIRANDWWNDFWHQVSQAKKSIN